MNGKMKKLTSNQRGFITLIVFLLIVLVAVIGLVYMRVIHAQK
jgi:Tfp pilus assembly protein PilX